MTFKQEGQNVNVQVNTITRFIRSEREINDLMDQCSDAENEGRTKFRSMSYESGILAALSWLLEAEMPHPLDD